MMPNDSESGSKGDRPASAFPKPRYQAPTVIPLAIQSRGSGACANGSADVICQSGAAADGCQVGSGGY